MIRSEDKEKIRTSDAIAAKETKGTGKAMDSMTTASNHEPDDPTVLQHHATDSGPTGTDITVVSTAAPLLVPAPNRHPVSASEDDSSSDQPGIQGASGTTEGIVQTDASPISKPQMTMEHSDSGVLESCDLHGEPARTMEIEESPQVFCGPSDRVQPPFSCTGYGPFFSYHVFGHAGSDDHSYQDAVAIDAANGFVAISDGTTLGGHSEIISASLTAGFVRERKDLSQEEEQRDWWLAVRKTWHTAYRKNYNDSTSLEQLKWDRGGSSTFTGLRFVPEGGYQLFHIGDGTVFWLRGNDFRALEGAVKHDSHPEVLHSDLIMPPAEFTIKAVKRCPGDTALLVTDALAKYLLAHRPWDRERFIDRLAGMDAEGFAAWTNDLRQADLLDSDDYTLLLLRFSAPSH
jgi:serine/threonine protein phosphatase PrpC